MGLSNYDITKNKMQKEFLKYDQDTMIQKFQLKQDADYLYLNFVGRAYRIDRHSGKVEWSKDEFVHMTDGDFNEAMSIYDVLCYSKADCHLSGQFNTIDNMKGAGYTSGPGNGMYQKYQDAFDHKCDELSRACELLGGTKEKIGDVSYQIPTFDFLPIQLQFWESDDEFSSNLKIMWDENILTYMHYETTYYVLGHLLDRLLELLGGEKT